jgi:hypothetical protein
MAVPGLSVSSLPARPMRKMEGLGGSVGFVSSLVGDGWLWSEGLVEVGAAAAPPQAVTIMLNAKKTAINHRNFNISPPHGFAFTIFKGKTIMVFHIKSSKKKPSWHIQF